MIKLGLTGSIGMGKSTTASMFRDEGIMLHDADLAVHELYENEAVGPVGNLFPEVIVNGRVDRKKLGSIVLNDPVKMRQLEKIVHPLVGKREQEFLRKAENSGAKLVVLDIPLLFETGAQNRVDKILVVTASADEQKRRVLARPGMDEQKFAAILSRQVADGVKRQQADFVIDTQKGMDNARQMVREIIQQLSA